MNLREFEACAQLVGCVAAALALAHDLECLIERVVDQHEPFEDMDTLQELPALKLKPLVGDVGPEFKEVPQAVLEREQLWARRSAFTGNEGCEIDRKVALKRGVLKEVRHRDLWVCP